MRSYKKNGSVIRLVKNVSTTDAEAIALRISKRFESLAVACDNKMLSTFPTDIIKEIVELCNDLKDAAPRHDIPSSYIEYVRENKEALGYFRKSHESMLDSEAKIINKRKIFSVFKDMLGNVKKL